MDMATESQSHLREYIDNGIQQKARLSNTLRAYQEQKEKTRERIIDQTQLKLTMQGKGIDPSKIALVEERKKMDEEVYQKVEKLLEDVQENLEGLVFRLNAHLEELTDIEIATGGFITHSIGISSGAQLDKDTMAVSFDSDGHIEVPIAIRLNKWRDSSQMSVEKIKRGTV